MKPRKKMSASQCYILPVVCLQSPATSRWRRAVPVDRRVVPPGRLSPDPPGPRGHLPAARAGRAARAAPGGGAGPAAAGGGDPLQQAVATGT